MQASVSQPARAQWAGEKVHRGNPTASGGPAAARARTFCARARRSIVTPRLSDSEATGAKRARRYPSPQTVDWPTAVDRRGGVELYRSPQQLVASMSACTYVRGVGGRCKNCAMPEDHENHQAQSQLSREMSASLAGVTMVSKGAQAAGAAPRSSGPKAAPPSQLGSPPAQPAPKPIKVAPAMAGG